MQDRHKGAFVLLRLIAAASILLPIALFSYAFWQTYEEQAEKADGQIFETLDIAEAHARNVFQVSDLAIQATNDVVAGLPDQAIIDRSAEFGQKFARIQRHIAQIQAIWLFDKNGFPLANSRIEPNPRSVNFAARRYFRAQKAGDAGFYIGRVLRPMMPGTPFFAVSRRRPETNASFTGVVAIALAPDYFRDLYAKIGHEFPRRLAILRSNGTVLVADASRNAGRSPWGSAKAARRLIRLAGQTGFVDDSGGERFGLRKIGRFPAYVATSVADSSVLNRTAHMMGRHLIFGVPATLALFALALAAIRNTKRLAEEAQKREMAEAALKQTQRLEALGQLTGGVAHDINNLLMVVGGNAELARKDAVSPRQLQRLEAVAEAVERGRALTRQLLTFSRRQSVDPTSTDLRDHLGRARVLLNASLGSAIVLTIETDPDLWFVCVDRDEFDIALLNLVVNAKDAMGEGGGELRLEARNVFELPQDVGADELSGSFVAISVSDSGAGMSSDVIERAFEPFFSTKPTGRGSGLGLSQVYGFCQQAGGVAAIRSCVGAGTTVTLYLPRWREAPKPQATEKPQGRRDLPQAASVLLVEDNDAVGELARDHLEDLGMQVTWAQNADVALQIIAETQSTFDLLASDIVMPGKMDGIQLAREFKRLAPGSAILLMTGYAPYLTGAVDEFPILRKPFTRSSLELALAQAFESNEAGVGAKAPT